MYAQWAANGTVMAATVTAVLLSVLVHYEGLVITQRRIAREHLRRRLKVLHAVSLLILLHAVEVWIFGMFFFLLLLWPDCGRLLGQDTIHFLDYIYFSAMCYTTVGFGDISPLGPIRFLAATEALTGLVLITWSASFTYLEMERFWRSEK
jgi:hypothetical protein